MPPAALGVALATVGALAGVCVRTVAPLSARSLPDWWGGAALALECLVCLGACCLLGARCGRRPGLERLTRFHRSLGTSEGVDGLLLGVLAQAREVLDVPHAEIVLVSHGSLVRLERDADAGTLRRVPLGEESGTRAPWDRVLARGETLLLRSGAALAPEARDLLLRRGLREAVLAPLPAGGGAAHGGQERAVSGALLAGVPEGHRRTLRDGDVQLLGAVAGHVGVMLHNGRLVDRLRHASLHDAVTGLPNRLMLSRVTERALDDIGTGASPGACVITMDLVGFKRANNTLGHRVGDGLLQEVGRRLGAALPEGALLARLEGDEFAAVLPGVSEPAAALDAARALCRALETPIALEGVGIEIGVHVGVAVAPRHGDGVEVLLQRAGAAMAGAGARGHGVGLFDPCHDTVESPECLALIAELRAGIQQHELELHIQPQMCLRTGEIRGGEILVRWRHPRHGLLFPDEFIPLAESTGLIRPLTTAVLEGALAVCGRLREAGHDLVVSVNLSACSTSNDEIVDEVRSLLARCRVPPAALTLEITESSVITDPGRAGEVLQQLHALGVGLSLDDFGTGYSSLSYLRRLPVHEVKVDKSFVTTMRRDPEDATIVRSIIDLAANLGLLVVAEGVEDADTWAELSEMGCDLAQGHYLARPQPLADFQGWMEARATSPRPESVAQVS